MPFLVRKIHPDAIIPTRKHEFDAGVDIHAIWDVVIHPWSQGVVDTGIELVRLPVPEIVDMVPMRLYPPREYFEVREPILNREWKSVLQIWPRSGLDAKIALHTGAGIVDYLYRGEIKILVKNQSDTPIIIHKGDAIAQGVVVPCYVGDVVEVTDTNETERGKSGGIAETRND